MNRILSWPLKPFLWFKATRRRNKIIAVIVVGAVLFILISSITANRGQEYTTVPVKRANIVEVVSETGKITAASKTDIYSSSTGIVEEVYVRNGEEVKQDSDLFKVKSTATQQEKSAAYSTYLTSKNSLDAANAASHSLQADMFDAWDEFKVLAKSGTYETSDGTPKYENRSAAQFHIAEKDWLAAESKYKNNQSVIAQAQAATNNAWLLYQATQDMVVKSTAMGLVANLAVAPGSFVTAKTPTNSVSPVLTVVMPSLTEVVVSLSETDIAKVKEGQSTTLEISALDNKEYKGVVRRVDSIGTDENGVTRFKVYIEVLGTDTALRAGMNADATITTQKVSNVLSVPNSAIKPYKGGRAVRVKNQKGEIEYIPVKIGVRGKTATQILEGVTEGQEVITSLSNQQLKRPGLF